MAIIRKHPRWSTFVAAALVIAALWAVLPAPFVREAEAASPTLKALIEKVDALKAAMDADHALLTDLNTDHRDDDARVPRSWVGLPAGVTQRFELVLPVGNAQPDNSHFQAVLDHRTGLIWQRVPNKGFLAIHSLAQNAAAKAATGRVGGWRIPSIAEFASIAEDSNQDGELDRVHSDFPWGSGDRPHGEFWTSDPAYVGRLGYSSRGGSAGLQNQIIDKVFSIKFHTVPGGVIPPLTVSMSNPGHLYDSESNPEHGRLLPVWLVMGPR